MGNHKVPSGMEARRLAIETHPKPGWGPGGSLAVSGAVRFTSIP